MALYSHPPGAAEDDGMTLNLLKNSKSQLIPFSDLDKLYASLSGYHACIDAGAWFRGIKSSEVAKKMLENLPDSISAVVYFNDQDVPPGTKGQAVVMQRGKSLEDLQLLSQTKDRLSRRRSYPPGLKKCKNVHCRGNGNLSACACVAGTSAFYATL